MIYCRCITPPSLFFKKGAVYQAGGNGKCFWRISQHEHGFVFLSNNRYFKPWQPQAGDSIEYHAKELILEKYFDHGFFTLKQKYWLSNKWAGKYYFPVIDQIPEVGYK